MSKRAPKKKTVEKEAVEIHYEFDDEFLQEYRVLITMLLERGYAGDGLIGVVRTPVDHVEDEDDVEDGIFGPWTVAIDPFTTKEELTKKYSGLERFSLALKHQDTRLNMLVYYAIPETESHGSAQERKQLSASHIKELIRSFDESAGYSRLLLISKSKLSADAATEITAANYNRTDEQPLRLVKYIPASFFKFNPMRWHMQPRDVQIHREEEKRRMLDELNVRAELRGQEESLIPQVGERDPLVLYYGAKVGEVITFIRTVPSKAFFMRIVLQDLEVQ